MAYLDSAFMISNKKPVVSATLVRNCGFFSAHFYDCAVLMLDSDKILPKLFVRIAFVCGTRSCVANLNHFNIEQRPTASNYIDIETTGNLNPCPVLPVGQQLHTV